MRVNEINYENARPIDGYGPGFFRIGGKVHEAPLMVTAETVTGWGGFEDTATPLAYEGEIDVLFVGTGPEMLPVPKIFRTAMQEAGIGIEPMPTTQACRTFNILLAEGRRVAAVLLSA